MTDIPIYDIIIEQKDGNTIITHKGSKYIRLLTQLNESNISAIWLENDAIFVETNDGLPEVFYCIGTEYYSKELVKLANSELKNEGSDTIAVDLSRIYIDESESDLITVIYCDKKYCGYHPCQNTVIPRKAWFYIDKRGNTNEDVLFIEPMNGQLIALMRINNSHEVAEELCNNEIMTYDEIVAYDETMICEEKEQKGELAKTSDTKLSDQIQNNESEPIHHIGIQIYDEKMNASHTVTGEKILSPSAIKITKYNDNGMTILFREGVEYVSCQCAKEWGPVQPEVIIYYVHELLDDFIFAKPIMSGIIGPSLAFLKIDK